MLQKLLENDNDMSALAGGTEITAQNKGNNKNFVHPNAGRYRMGGGLIRISSPNRKLNNGEHKHSQAVRGQRVTERSMLALITLQRYNTTTHIYAYVRLA